ncbi:hypothetical protein J437_LFUL012180, partial [Ladona fulva]
GKPLLARENFEVVYQWILLDYDWESQEQKEEAIESGEFDPKNNTISGIKIWKDRVFVSTPRLLSGVPSTINWLQYPAKKEKNPQTKPLIPFPNWEMQKVGNCSAIQNVQSMEIDTTGRMWVLDVGSKYLLTPTPNTECRPKLLIYDLNEDADELLHVHVFSEEVASEQSFLNDLVLDINEERGHTQTFAYIADSGMPGGIVVYHFENDTTWRVEDNKTMNADPDAVEAKVGDKEAMLSFNIDGIALTPPRHRNKLVFYSPLGSFHLYSIPAEVLMNPDCFGIKEEIHDYGTRSSQSDGMMFDNKGNLYFGLLANNSLAVWSHSNRRKDRKGRIREIILAKDNKKLIWIDSLGFDLKGFLWFTSNRLQNIQAMDVPEDEVNYRINRIRLAKKKSYMYN